jgi:beta-N-acetylhexosaminidase
MPKKLVAILVLVVSLAGGSFAKDKFLAPGPVRLTSDGDKWAQKTLKKMSLEEKIGQMLMIWSRAEFLNVDNPEYLRLRDTMRRYHIGSFGLTVRVDDGFLLRNQPYEAAMLINQLQRDSELPLIFAADFERGLSMRLHGVTVFPHAMAFGADGNLADAEAFGRITGQEARALGVEWNFFPVADVNSNPANPIINTRAFGGDPRQVGALASAYIKGAHEAGMLTTAKHFPGHGDTATDSHLGLAMVDGNLERLNQVELPPFQAEINAGVDSVMVAHVTVPALDPDPKKVASTSYAITTDLLKKKMGFQGLVVTDGLAMNGLMRLYSGNGQNPSYGAAAAAMKAGNDMILVPEDVGAAFEGMLHAVKSGEVSEAQVNASVLKILRAKASVGLNKARLVDISQMDKIIATQANLAAGQRVADAAVTLVRDSGQALPVKAAGRGTPDPRNPYLQVNGARNRVVAVVFSDDVRSESGRVFERELRARVPDAKIFFVDPRLAGGMSEQAMKAVDQAGTVIAPVYVIPTAGKAVQQGGELKNTVSMQNEAADLLHRILQQAAPRTIVIAMGNPYVASDFPEVQTYLCTFSNATVSELAAVKAIFGEIPIRGKLPVTIPAIAERGSGIERQQAAKTGGKSDANTKTAAAP